MVLVCCCSEIVKIQLRVYLGAVMKRPENVLIMRHVFFEGLRNGSRTRVAPTVGDYADDEEGQYDLVRFNVPPTYLEEHNKIDLEDFVGHHTVDAQDAFSVFRDELIRVGALALENTPDDYEPDDDNVTLAGNDYDADAATIAKLDTDWVEDGNPTVWYQGTSKHEDDNNMYASNSGHMGNLDHPAVADRLFGTFVYNSLPDPSPASCPTTI